MIATVRIDSKIRYRDVGKGNTIVLLHGYLESLKVWNGIVKGLKDDYRVIAIDLPGQGHSTISKEVQTMEIMAKEVKLVLNNLKVDKCFMIGHSLGGYVSLAFLELFPEMLTGISLFHSSPYSDTEEKKRNRDREIELLKKGKKNMLYSMHMSDIFAKDNVANFAKRIEKLTERAKKTPTEYIISVLKGMKQRPDRSELLKNTKLPVQYVIGAKDNFIPMSILNTLQLPEKSEVVTLKNSGHIGMYEEKEKSIEIIKAFMDKYKVWDLEEELKIEKS